ncbi:MAG: hypothetical protein GEU73_16885 [Chloroflexi bacterium]|nr:hypothetical protein [Chloroflexota bacterium]
MPSLFQTLDCLSLPVSDLDGALDFYSAQIGHQLIWRTDKATGLRLPESNAELVLRTDDRPMETDLAVESVPRAIEQFTHAGLPKDVQRRAHEAYRRFLTDPVHPAARFKPVQGAPGVRSARVGLGYCALATRDGEVVI